MDEDPTFRFSLRMPKLLHAQLTASADAHGNSLNAELLRLLSVGLASENKEPDKTLIEQLLSPSMIWRLDRFRLIHGVRTREDAAKRLVKIALDEQERAPDILDKLYHSFKSTKNLRVLSRDILAEHSAIESLSYGPNDSHVWFQTKAGESGAITQTGKLLYSQFGNNFDSGMEDHSPRDVAGKELDNPSDDIPF